MTADLEQMRRPTDIASSCNARFFEVLAWHDQLVSIAARMRRGKQYSADGFQFSAQRELAIELETSERRIALLRAQCQLARCQQNAQRDRQVETPALFRHVSRREVHRNTPCGKL